MAGKAEVKPNPVPRKAYGMATTKLRTVYKVEFDRYLDEAYAELGAESPRAAGERRDREQQEKRREFVARSEERRLAKIADLKAQLERLEGARSPLS